MKLTISKSKNSATFYVQKSIRKDNGTISSVTVEKLGNLEEVRTKAGGEDPYVWARKYVEDLNRKEYEQQKEIILSFSPAKLLKKDQAHSFNCGYLFLQDIYYSLGLDRICSKISSRHSFDYDLNDILSKLVYTRILYPSSKQSSFKRAHSFIEQPSFELHDVYRALSVLAEENDFIQAELYKNSQSIVPRRKDILYYDCTNYYFELEREDDFRRYGNSKQHQPLPLVGMGLFMDNDGIPLAFDIFPGNQNEQPTLKPLEQKVIRDYGLDQVIVCTDAGLSSAANRRFNDRTVFGERKRGFVTTQSIKTLPDYLKEFSLDPEGWHLSGDSALYDIQKLDEERYFDSIFYKERWITEEAEQGEKPLEQHLIVSFSLKYKQYQSNIRSEQAERAKKMISSGSYKRHGKNQTDPARLIGHQVMTEDGEKCEKDIPYLDENVIAAEEQYDGFYAICTNLEEMGVEEILQINKGRWEIEECFRIMKTDFKARPVYLQREDRIKSHFLTCYLALFIYRILEKKLEKKYTCEDIISTLKDMRMYRPGEKIGWLPAYTRTDLTDALHEAFGFRTDHEITNDLTMKRIIRQTKVKKKKKK